MSWNDAEEFCKAEGGHLASVTSHAIKNFVREETLSRGLTSAWFGGNEVDAEGAWKWVDGATWEFTFWGPGQPDGMKADGEKSNKLHCLCYSKKWGWDDSPCYNEKKFVCSKKIC